MRQHGWLLLAAAGLSAIGCYFLTADPYRSLVYDLPRVLALGACLVAARRQPARRRMWLLLAAAIGWFVVGSVVYLLWPGAPSPADAIFVAGYVLVVAAVASLPASRRTDVVGAALDAALLTAAAAVFAFVFVFQPLSEQTDTGTLAQLVAGAYPVGDLLLLGLLVTMMLRAATPWLLIASVMSLLASDLVYSGLQAHDAYDADSFVNGGWMASYVLLGVAALMPHARPLEFRALTVAASWRRLVLVGASLFAVPVAGGLQRLTGDGRVDDVALVAFGAAIALLACARLAAIARERHRSEQHFRALIETTNDIGLIVDPESGVVYVAPQAERILGLRPEACLGTACLALVHPDDRERIASVVEGAFGGLAQESVFRVRAGDGRYRTLAATGRVFDTGPHAGSLLVSARDISRRVAIEEALAAKEEELRQSQRLEAVGHLAGGVAHDFNNLLTAICGYGELAQAEAAAWGNAKLRDDIAELLRAAERAGTLTRQLLAFSRRQRLQPQKLELNDALHALDSLLRRLIGEHIEFVTILADEPLWIEADPGQLEQVLLNLAVNARDAMPSGGTLTVTLAGDADTVTVTVADTGNGMDAETRSRAFDPFFTTKPVGEGTGLGLATVYGIVVQSGGSIAVSSEPGAGATFTLTLPRSLPAIAAACTGDPSPAAGAGRVLLVEDEAQVRAVGVRILRDAGYEVLEACEGEEALRVLERERCRVDLLLTDVVMPRLSGPELAARARALCPDLPVLFCSGYASDAFAHHDDLAEHEFLAKPFTVTDLLRAVERSLGAPELPRVATA